MKNIVITTVLLIVISTSLFLTLSEALNPPTGTPISLTGVSILNFPLTKVIAAPNLFTKGPYSPANPTAGSIYSPSRIKFFAANVTTNPSFRNGGLIGTDISYYRGTFYQNPIASAGTVAFTAFAQQQLNDSSSVIIDPNTGFLDVARSRDFVAIADDLRVLIYNITNAQYISPNPYLYPSFVLQCNNISVCNYPTTQSGTGVAADDNNIYYGNTFCASVLVFNTSSINSPQPSPAYSLGTNSTRTCGGCNATSPYTCLRPSTMDTDCYGGVWVFDIATKSILHFSSGSTVADFAISAPSIPGAFTITSTSQIAVNKNRCSFMAVATSSSYQAILNITYSGTGVPTAVSAYAVIGSTNTNPTPDNSTNSIGPVAGITWDDTNSGNIWLADISNNRYITFNPFGAVVPSNSPTISLTPSTTSTASVTSSISVSPSHTATPSVTVSITPSISISPSISPSLSLTSSISLSASASPSTGASLSPSTTASLSSTPSVTGAVSSSSVPSNSNSPTPLTASASIVNSGQNSSGNSPVSSESQSSVLASYTAGPASNSPSSGSGGAAATRGSWVKSILL